MCSAQAARLASIRLDAQSAPPHSERLTFDAVEIRHVAAGSTSPPRLRPMPNGRVEIRAITLWELLRVVYGHEAYRTPRQVLEGPEWLEVQRFDIDAAGNGDPRSAVLPSPQSGTLLEGGTWVYT